jgi:hypothetical protein
MIQKYLHKQHSQETIVKTSKTAYALYLNKVVISLDNTAIGHVTAEENNMMVVADSGSGDKFHTPSCKVITVDNEYQ